MWTSSKQQQGREKLGGFNILRPGFVLETFFFLNLKTSPSSFLLLWVELKSAPEVQTFQFPAFQEEFLCFGLRLVNVAMRRFCLFFLWGLCGGRKYVYRCGHPHSSFHSTWRLIPKEINSCHTGVRLGLKLRPVLLWVWARAGAVWDLLAALSSIIFVLAFTPRFIQNSDLNKIAGKYSDAYFC